MGAGLAVRVGGHTVHLSRDEVTTALENHEPGPIRTHAVEVGGRLFAVKEAFAIATGLDIGDFNSHHARNIFQRLGFQVRRVS